MEFTEIIWKATVKLAYNNKQDYMQFMGNYSTVVSVALIVSLCLLYMPLMELTLLYTTTGWNHDRAYALIGQ